MNAAVAQRRVEPLNLAPIVVDWDDNNMKEVEEAKLVYQQARRENRKIVDQDGNPIQVFKPSLLSFRILGFELAPTQVALRIVNDKGDETIVWDATRPKEVKEAATKFQDYIKKGWRAYAVDMDGNRIRIRSFDATAEEMSFEEDKAPMKLQKFAESFKTVKMLPRTYPG